MLAFGLSLGHSLATMPALLNGTGLPPLQNGWAFVTIDAINLVFEGQLLIVEVR